MKRSLTLAFILSALCSTVSAGSFFGRVDKYMIKDSGMIIEVATNEISDDGLTAKYYNYKERKFKTIELAELSKSTQEEIAGVRSGEMVLVQTYAGASRTETISRFCEVFYVFENKKAFVGCKTYAADQIPGYATPSRLDFIVNNVESIVAEVESLEGIKKGDVAELRIDTKSAKAGRQVRVLAIFANGEALVQKTGLGILDTSSIVYKGNIDRVSLTDLN